MERFRVFLSYKHTGEDGLKTKDAYMAEELYAELTRRGVRTFYSSETIRNLGKAQYKIAIDDALDEVALLVAVGTSVEHLESNWVKYEWDGFYNDILSCRRNGEVISYIDDVRHADLPRTLRLLQSFERGKNSVSEVCDFICNYLNSGYKEEVKAENCRVVSLTELFSHGFSALDVEAAFTENDKKLYEDMPAEVAGTAEQWAEIIQKYPEFTAAVVDGDYNIYGNYTLMGLSDHEEQLLSKGALVDAELSGDKADNLYMAGQHAGYLLNLSVDPMLESPEMYSALWQNLVGTLKKSAEDNQVYFKKIYYKAFLPDHEAKVAAKGFRLCCRDAYYGNIFVHDMDPDTSLPFLDPELAEIYKKGKSKKKSHKKKNITLQELDALTAYADLWKQIEELFYKPEYCRLKKYFMGGKGIPENSMEYKMGLAVSEWIRDALQYLEALLPFVPEEQQSTYEQYKDRIYSSEIVQDSIKQYEFTTEEEGLQFSDTSGFSVASLITFAYIWMDIDKLFMLPELLDCKQYFYENKDQLPPEEDLEICEMLAVRILSVFIISERQLRRLPFEYAESYYNYRDMICSSKVAQSALQKSPFLRRELFRS